MTEQKGTYFPVAHGDVGEYAGHAEPQSADLVYEPVPNWGWLPHGFTFNGDATSVAVDSRDRVYVFNRGPIPVLVFESDGTFVAGWGEGEYDVAHGIAIDDDDLVVAVWDRRLHGGALTSGVQVAPASLSGSTAPGKTVDG